MRLFIFLLYLCTTTPLAAQILSIDFDRPPAQGQNPSSSLQDRSTYQHPIHIHGGLTYIADRFGIGCRAGLFSGDALLEIPHNSIFDLDESFTATAWLLLPDSLDFQWITLVCKGLQPIESFNSPAFRAQVTSQTVSINTSSTKEIDEVYQVYPKEKWFHFALSFDEGHIKIYVDGILYKQFHTSARLGQNRYPVTIGYDVPGNEEYFIGAMDDFYLFDKALSDRKIFQYFKDTRNQNLKSACPAGIPDITQDPVASTSLTNLDFDDFEGADNETPGQLIAMPLDDLDVITATDPETTLDEMPDPSNNDGISTITGPNLDDLKLEGVEEDDPEALIELPEDSIKKIVEPSPSNAPDLDETELDTVEENPPVQPQPIPAIVKDPTPAVSVDVPEESPHPAGDTILIEEDPVLVDEPVQQTGPVIDPQALYPPRKIEEENVPLKDTLATDQLTPKKGAPSQQEAVPQTISVKKKPDTITVSNTPPNDDIIVVNDIDSLAVGRKIILDKIEFARHSHHLNDRSKKVLTRLAEKMKENPEFTILLEGHTELDGSYEANMALSKRRADACKRYLVKRRKIKSKRVQVKYHGPDNPITRDPEFLWKNRRVEVTVF